MKYIFVTAFLFSLQAGFAQDVRVKVEDFSFQYDDPKGSGEATLFEHNQRQSLEGVKVEVEKIGEAMNFKVSGSENHEFNLEKAPDVVMKAKTMVVDDLDLAYEDSLSFSVLEGEFIGEDQLHLKNFTLNCNKDLSQKLPEDQLIFGCLQKMAVKSQSFSQSAVEEGMVKALTKAIGSVAGARGDLQIKALDFKINNGKYELGADVKAQMSGRAKSTGNMSYDPKTSTMTIKISEVKFGILTVTGMVFDELKKNENDHLQVKQPNVYYKLK